MSNRFKEFALNHLGDFILPRIYRHHVETLRNSQLRQEQVFQQLKQRLAGTLLAQEIQINRYSTFKEFIRHFPAQPYAFYEPYVKRVMEGEPNVMYRDATEYFLVTSGTSGFNNKIIPCNSSLRKVIAKTQQKALATIFPECRGLVLTSDRFAYGSRSNAETIRGIPKDYISGIVPFLIPKMLREYVVPSSETQKEPDWTSKVRRMAQETRHRDIRGIFGLPAYLLHVLSDLVKEWRISSLREIWPNLELCAYSGTSVHPYRHSLNQLAGVNLKFFGAYVSTESPLGFEMPALTDQPEHMCFLPDLVLYSFQDLNGKNSTPLTLDELKIGGTYLVNLGTPNGIVHYSIRDYIRVSQTTPFVQFELMGRYGAAMNVAAEKVSEIEIEKAVNVLQKILSIQIQHYFVFPSEEASDRPAYEWIFATDTSLPSESLSEQIDKALMCISADYKEARQQTNVLAPPIVRTIPSHCTQNLADRLQGSGQFKLPHAFLDKQAFLTFSKTYLDSKNHMIIDRLRPHST